MAIILKKSFNKETVATIKTKRRYENTNTNVNHRKHKPILTDSTLDRIRENKRFNKEYFYSLNLTNMNTWLNTILKNANSYEELVVKADLRLAVHISKNYIRIHYLSKHIFKIKLNRFKITLQIIHQGHCIFEGDLSIKQNELDLILKNA